jgi:hypothetical protein
MPYPESCPECGSAFRNTGTHFTARRNEVGRHVLLELGCQNTTRRFWWDFTIGNLTEDGQPSTVRRAVSAANNGFHHAGGHARVSTLDPPQPAIVADTLTEVVAEVATVDDLPVQRAVEDTPEDTLETTLAAQAAEEEKPIIEAVEFPAPSPVAAGSLKEAFVRQLQLDRLTLRQMRSWLMSDEARRAIEVAAGATEATYERLALILFGVDLPQLLGKQAAPPPSTGISAEERLELQREKARIRARLRRAAAKAARQPV